MSYKNELPPFIRCLTAAASSNSKQKQLQDPSQQQLRQKVASTWSMGSSVLLRCHNPANVSRCISSLCAVMAWRCLKAGKTLLYMHLCFGINFVHVISFQCAVLENYCTPTEGIGNCWGGWDLKDQKKIKRNVSSFNQLECPERVGSECLE